MRLTVIVSTVLLTLNVYADQRCFSNEQNEYTHLSECHIEVSYSQVKQCKNIKIKDKDGEYKYVSVPKKIGWGYITLVDKKCDVSIEQCRQIARNYLDGTRTSECGEVAHAKKAKIEFDKRDYPEQKFLNIWKEKFKKNSIN